MIKNQKNKYYALWAVTILLLSLYLLDRSQIKKRINGYKSDIALIEKELINDVLIDNIDDSKNYFESIINKESQNITDSQLGLKLIMKRLAKKLNISICQLEIDPKNSFLVNFK